MKKRMVLLVSGIIVCLSILSYFNVKSKNNLHKINTENKNNSISIMIKEDGEEEYKQSFYNTIPKGYYALNEEKTYCKNNGKVSNYDNTTGTISFSFIGTDECRLFFDGYPPGYLKILNDNGGNTTIESKGSPSFLNASTTNDGMYAASDDYTATTGMKSYYYRGAVNNNWVKFGKDNEKDIYWRIIRINGDGSIRMIYSGTNAPTSDSATMTGDETQIKTNAFNNTRNSPSHVGYMYTTGQQHGNNLSSNIKWSLEAWYAGTTLKDNKLVSEDQIFCNDRSVTDGTWSSNTSTTTYYATRTRLYSYKRPTLICSTDSDKFTSKNSNLGNKALTYPVGLITADEVAMAGGVVGTYNNSYYLYTKQTYWAGSPAYFDGGNTAMGFLVKSSGDIDQFFTGHPAGMRAVISLSTYAKLSGTGTWDDPYEVS